MDADESARQPVYPLGASMQRLTAIFIAVCVIVIAASIGAAGYLVFHLSGAEAAILALAIMTALALYNTVSGRQQDRDRIGAQIADLSRGTADLARQVGEVSRKVYAFEAQDTGRGPASNGALAAEIGELSLLLKELADAVASHEARLQEIGSASPVRLAEPAEDKTAPAVQAGAAPAEASVSKTPAADAPAAPVQTPPVVSDPVATGPLKGLTASEIAAKISSAIDTNRIDLYLQPVVTLPQRKVRYYEAMTRLRLENGTLVLPSDFLPHAEKAKLIAKIDNMQLFRCVQVLRRLLLKNREVGVFCNLSMATLNDSDAFRQVYDFLAANRALSSSLTLEFTQDALRSISPVGQESLAGLIALGFRFSMDHVTDLRIGPRDLSELGISFVKVPAQILLSKGAPSADMQAADLSDLLGRHGISLIAERIETEAVVVDLLDCDVRYGQGFLFSAPRPVRADALQGVGGVSSAVERPFAEAGIAVAARTAI